MKKHYKWNGTEWTSVSTLPYSFFSGSVVVYNNEIHILGGLNNSTAHYTIAEPVTIIETTYSSITKNLQKVDEGYLVTDSGYVEIVIGGEVEV